MSRCDQKQGLLGYCKKESMHPGDHYNGKIRWPRTGIDQEKYLDHLDFMQDIELQVQASADRFRAEHYQLIENQERRDREQQQRQLADTGRRLVGGYNPATTDFARRELEKLVGRRGPACLLAMIPDPGMAEPGWIAWMAVPSWEHSPITAARVSADAPPGWRARAAAWDAAMPNELWIHVRDLFASGRCGEGGVAQDGSYAQIGVAINDSWSQWYLECPPPPVPNTTDSRVWEMP